MPLNVIMVNAIIGKGNIVNFYKISKAHPKESVWLTL